MFIINQLQIINLLGLIGQILTLVIYSSVLKRNTLEKTLYALIVCFMGIPLIIQLFFFLKLPLALFNILIFTITIIGTLYYRKKIKFSAREYIRKVKENIISVSVPLIIVAYFYYVAATSKLFNIDGLLYHGPLLANLTQNKFWGMNLINQYSSFTELGLLASINLIKSTEEVILDDSVSIPFYLIMLLAMVAILRNNTNSNKIVITIYSLTILSAPVIWMQNKVLGTDLSYAAAVVALLYCLTKISANKNLELFIFGIVLAFMIGSRPNSIIFAVLISPFILTWILVYKKVEVVRTIFLFTIAYILGSLAMFRNLIEFRNPFYPIQANIAGYNFEGPVSQDIYQDPGSPTGTVINLNRIYDFASSIYLGSIKNVTKLDYDPRETGFGRVLLGVCLVLLVSSIAKTYRKKVEERNNSKQKEIIGIGTIFILIYLLSQRNSFDSRYTISAFVILSLIIFCLISIIGYARYLVYALLPCLLISSIYYNETRLEPNGSKKLLTEIKFGNVSDGFEWLSQEGKCKSIIIQTNGGLGKDGIKESAPLNILYYPYFGNRLCNSIFAFTEKNKDIYGNIISDTQWNTLLNKSDYLVVYTKDEAETIIKFNKVNSRITYERISIIEPILDHWLVRPDGQTVFELR